MSELHVEFAAVERHPYVLYRTKTKNAHSQSLEVIVNKVLHHGDHSEIFRGLVKGTNGAVTNSILALKLCYSKDSMHHLDIEAKRYDELKKLQGDVIPTCFGLFEGSTATGVPLKCLVLEHCGETLPAVFHNLLLEYR